MENAYARMNPLDLFDRVIAGLDDEHEIKILCNLMLAKLIVLDPDETSRRLDTISERFRVILSFKAKDNTVKQDIEKSNEAIRAALKTTVLLHNAFPAASGPHGVVANVQGQSWRGYWDWVNKDFRSVLWTVEQEAKSQAA